MQSKFKGNTEKMERKYTGHTKEEYKPNTREIQMKYKGKTKEGQRE